VFTSVPDKRHKQYHPGSNNAYTRTSNHASRPWRAEALYSRREDDRPPIIISREVYTTSEREYPRVATREAAPVTVTTRYRDVSESESDADDVKPPRQRPRSRSPPREPPWRDDDEDVRWAAEDDLVDADTYRQFSLSWLADLNSSAHDGESSDIDTVPDDKTVSTQDKPTMKGAKGVQAYSSWYSGTADIGGDHGANITELHDPQNQTRPLLRWL
jgi:hypothetical protein